DARQRVRRKHRERFELCQALVSGGGGRQRLANDKAFDARVQARQPGGTRFGADLVAPLAQFLEGLVARDAHELVSDPRALVDLLPLEAMPLVSCNRT